MVVLALETVTPAGSLAIARGGRVIGATGEATSPHAARLPGVLTDWLQSHGLTLADVDRLAVVSGPGSFTGVRIGMACAQGLAVTRGWRIALVPTLDAIAEGWRHHLAGPAPATVVACLDGMRGEVFTASVRWDGEAWGVMSEPRVHVPSAETCAGLPAPVVIVGSGAVRYRDVWEQAGAEVRDAAEPLAASAARLALQPAWPLDAPAHARPVYVRRPDVELARERRGQG